jgi:hypothetical protein
LCSPSSSRERKRERNLKEELENFAAIVERGELGGPRAQTPSR